MSDLKTRQVTINTCEVKFGPLTKPLVKTIRTTAKHKNVFALYSDKAGLSPYNNSLKKPDTLQIFQSFTKSLEKPFTYQARDDRRVMFTEVSPSSVPKPPQDTVKPPHIPIKQQTSTLLTRRALRTKESHWKPQSQLAQFDSSVTIVLGETHGQKNCFRAFVNTVTQKDPGRIAQLLPHRMRKTYRLYGVTPMVLLKRTVRKVKGVKTVQGMQGVKGDGRERIERVEGEKIERIERIDGPEIEPNFGEADEFGSFDVLSFDALHTEESQIRIELA